MIEVRLTGNTLVIDVDDNGQSVSSHPVGRKITSTHFRAGGSDEHISLGPSKTKKTSLSTLKARRYMHMNIGGANGKKATKCRGDAKGTKTMAE